MKKNNFIITGYGRSGTKFLSNVLNKSEKWTVLHEPRKSEAEKAFRAGQTKIYINKINRAFNKEYYGEVNSYLRFYLSLLIKEYNMGVIIRNPKDIITSVFNRKKIDNYKFYINDLKGAYDTFDKYQNELKIIDFYKMTSDKNYLINISKTFSIFDINSNDINFKENNNKNKHIKYKSFSELPKNIKTHFYKQFGHEYNIFNNFTFTDF